MGMHLDDDHSSHGTTTRAAPPPGVRAGAAHPLTLQLLGREAWRVGARETALQQVQDVRSDLGVAGRLEHRQQRQHVVCIDDDRQAQEAGARGRDGST